MEQTHKTERKNVKYPGVTVCLTGTNSNVFAIIGAVSRALKRAGEREAAEAFPSDAMDCESYDDVLRLVMETVEVE